MRKKTVNSGIKEIGGETQQYKIRDIQLKHAPCSTTHFSILNKAFNQGRTVKALK
jgi:hypothetical protein